MHVARLIRITALATSIAAMLVPAAAHATVVSPIAIPPLLKKGTKALTLTMRGGQTLDVQIRNNKAGRRLLPKVQGRKLSVLCAGLDATNTISYTLSGEVKWGKRAKKVRVRTSVPIVTAGCSVGKDLFSSYGLVDYGIVDPDGESKGPDAQYQPQFIQLSDLVGAEFGAEITLADMKGDPTPQQLVDEIIKNQADSEYTPPMPLVAVAGATAYPAAGSLGVFVDTRRLYALMTHTDAQPLAAIWDFSGVS